MASVTLVPTGYDGQRSSYISVDASYPLSNGLTSSSSNTFTVLNLNTGGGAVSKLAVKFDVSKIPTDAKINSISCKIKARISNASPYILSGVAQLYCGTAGLSGEIELGTSPVAQTFNDTGWWDRESLDDLILLITCTRGSLSANNSHTRTNYDQTLPRYIHQYAQGTVDGVPGTVDLDRLVRPLPTMDKPADNNTAKLQIITIGPVSQGDANAVLALCKERGLTDQGLYKSVWA